MTYFHEIAGDRAEYVADLRPTHEGMTDDLIASMDHFLEPVAFSPKEVGRTINHSLHRAVGDAAKYFEIQPYPWCGCSRIQVAAFGDRVAIAGLRYQVDGNLFWDNDITITDRAGMRSAFYEMIAKTGHA